MQPLVLREKLRPPDPIGLVRQRLENQLSFRSAGTVGLVVAPAGSGKTTLLAQIAAHASGPAGWYRATADDDTEAALVANLARAIPGFTAPDCPLAMSALLARLEDVEGLEGLEGLLICDDLHEIAGTPAERALERFVDLRPRGLRLLFGSRRGSSINVPRLRGSGVAAEVDGAALRFRPWEVEELFEKIYREPLRPDAAALLTRRTGGWAAGLQLFHLATAGRSTAARHRAVLELGARSRLVRSYLTRHVLADLPDEHRRFLVRTCTLDRLTADLCDELLETTGSAQILSELELRQLFVSTDDGVEYRYHEVLRSHLEQVIVEELGDAGARAWYSRSGDVLVNHSRLRSAARAFAKAESWARVSEIVREHSVEIGDIVDDHGTISPPHSWRRDPWLALAIARRHTRHGQLADAVHAYQLAHDMHDEPSYRRQCRAESDGVVGWLPRTHAIPHAQKHWSARFRAALTGPVPPFVDGQMGNDAIQTVNGLVALVAGDLARARLSLGRIRSDRTVAPLLSALSGVGLAIADAANSAGEDAAGVLGELIVVAESDGFAWVARVAHALQEVVLVVSQHAAWRLAICTQMKDDCDLCGDRWGSALLTLMIGTAKLLSGDRAAAAIDLDDARKRFVELDAHVLALWCQILDLYAAGGTTAGAAELAAQADECHMGGARALALGAIDSRAGEAESVARSCGFPLAAFRATQTSAHSPEIHSGGVFCFGGLRIETAGACLDAGILRPQARSLLGILALNAGRPCRHEFLEDAIWPDAGHKVASHRLQVAVSSIRALLAGTKIGVERAGDAYRLQLPDHCSSDVRTFEDNVNRAHRSVEPGDRIRFRARALDVYRGELLPTEGRVEFIAAERERLRNLAAGAALDQAAELWRAGQAGPARQAAELSLRLEPYQDRPWDLLALIHSTLGDHTAAERARRDRARVRAAMGVN